MLSTTKTEPFGLMGVFSHNDHINVDFMDEPDYFLPDATVRDVYNLVFELPKGSRYQVLIKEVENE